MYRQMTGYPGRMYIPDGLPPTDSNEMNEMYVIFYYLRKNNTSLYSIL